MSIRTSWKGWKLRFVTESDFGASSLGCHADPDHFRGILHDAVLSLGIPDDDEDGLSLPKDDDTAEIPIPIEVGGEG